MSINKAEHVKTKHTKALKSEGLNVRVLLLMIIMLIFIILPDLPLEKKAVICFTGDILLDRGVKTEINKKGIDYLFEGVKEILGECDVAYGNLECPLTTGGTPVLKNRNLVFRSKPEYAAALRKAGFDILNLANNHTMDYGHDGLVETMNVLDRYGIAHTGAGMNITDTGKPQYLKKNGITIGFLGYSAFPPEGYFHSDDRPDVARVDGGLLAGEVTKAKMGCNFLTVSFHWGSEFRSVEEEEQIRLAHLAVDNGADIVIGHHPHVLQGTEVYKGKHVYYSLGNFVFDRQLQAGTDKSIILKLTVNERGFKSLEAIPLKIVNCRPAVP